MAETQFTTLKEPEIHREDILIVVDKYFKRANVAIVTGAASGVGRATAIAMGANGLTVLGVDIDEKRSAETVEMGRVLGGKIVFQKADLTKDADIQAVVKEAHKLGTVKFLANIAGIQHINAVEDFPMEMYDRMMAIMLRAPFYLSKLCIPHMKKSEDGAGVIGNMSSIHGHMVTKNKPVYNITKFGLRGLTQSIAADQVLPELRKADHK